MRLCIVEIEGLKEALKLREMLNARQTAATIADAGIDPSGIVSATIVDDPSGDIFMALTPAKVEE